ncbi:Ribosomal protein L11 methyltransferase [hydrothermal vent metagenome]|uniref:Ribosomal protein L11 methyltransferase n=1 Tax=hydrothermal vent metagenome TaxID=652676 RepID=A0A3B0UXX3_9ZZZZ
MEYEYFEIKISCIKSEADEIELLLLSIGACSVTYRDAKDTAILEPLPEQTPLWQDLQITAMFVKDNDEQRILTTIRKQLPAHEIVCERLQNQVWVRTWLEHFKPMLFGTRTWIIPSEFAAVDAKAVNIYLDPGLAFGTGTHATTALCLQWVDANNLQGMNVIDFGCGSGILAIAALKHGASKVYCTDIDPQAIESTLANAAKNYVRAGITVIAVDEVSMLENLDTVMANILAAPLMSLVDTFSHMLKTGGQLLMSGILVEQTDEIVAKFSPSFVDFQIKIVEDWACVYARKK